VLYRLEILSSSRHLVLVKTQLGTVYTHQEFKYEVIDIHS